MTSWAEEIRSFRGELTQQEYADALGVGLTTLRNWEQGVVMPRRRKREAVRARMRELHEQSDLQRIASTVAGRGFRHSISSRQRRYSQETIAALHQALDMVLDDARSDIAEHIMKLLEKFAARFAEGKEIGPAPHRRVFMIGPKEAEIIYLLALDRGSDEDAIMRTALKNGLADYPAASSAEKSSVSVPGRKKQRSA